MDQVKAVVFDAMGVLYRYGDVQGRVLIPYLHAQGCGVSARVIRKAYRSATSGSLTTGQFWETVEVSSAGRDEDYCRQHLLTEGTQDALEALAGDGLELACLSNDTAAWSAIVRHRFGLDRYIRRWFISSDLQARKPDPAPYDVALTALGFSPGEIVFVDDRPANLAPARSLGIHTILFHSDDTDAHPGPTVQHNAQCSVRTMPELVTAIRRLHSATT